MELYYFTGTGNSLAVARDIAAKTNGRLVSIPSVMNNETILPDTDALGIIFPVYHGGLPLILTRFLDKIKKLAGKYIFGVSTYGDHPGLAIHYLQKLVQQRGGQLAAGFAVNMPYNYITPPSGLKNFLSSFTLREIPDETRQALFTSEKEKIEIISAFVNARKVGTYETDSAMITNLVDALNLRETFGKSTWLKIAGVTEKTNLSFLESRQLMDHAFHVDDKCSGCGICSQICPASNIKMVDGQPEWLRRCEQCFACLQWCPQEALQFGINTSGKKRYHHPEVKLAELLQPQEANP
jgi:Pyruvate/2-oxoacid:ferredoxin oxidoreductase delta subunit/flavodoxin